MAKRRLWVLMLACLGVLGCSEELQTAVSKETQNIMREQLVQTANEQCLNVLPQPLQEVAGARAEELCLCTAEKMVDSIELSDLPSALANWSQNNVIQQKASEAALQCLQERTTSSATSS